MEIKINGDRYTSLSQLPASLSADVVDFLHEWFSPADYVVGHTSGSTGTPRPLQLAKRDMIASATITNRFLGITSSSSLLLCLSPRYIAGKMMIVRALTAGAMLHVVEPSSTPLTGWNTPIDMAAMIPMQVAATLQQVDGVAALSQVSKLLVGGAPITPALESTLATLPLATYMTYGMTETVSHIALRRIGDAADCYEALGDVTFTTDARDCLVIDAPHLSTRQFITNDVVSLLDPRHFRWVGRYDNVIISGGLKYSAEALEQRIAPLITSRYYITAAPDERLGQRIILVIEGEPCDEAALQQLRQRLMQHLTHYEMPREIHFLPHFAETYSGKVKREIPTTM